VARIMPKRSTAQQEVAGLGWIKGLPHEEAAAELAAGRDVRSGSGLLWHAMCERSRLMSLLRPRSVSAWWPPPRSDPIRRPSTRSW
jgi:hypothetical protein